MLTKSCVFPRSKSVRASDYWVDNMLTKSRVFTRSQAVRVCHYWVDNMLTDPHVFCMLTVGTCLMFPWCFLCWWIMCLQVVRTRVFLTELISSWPSLVFTYSQKQNVRAWHLPYWINSMLMVPSQSVRAWCFHYWAQTDRVLYVSICSPCVLDVPYWLISCWWNVACSQDVRAWHFTYLVDLTLTESHVLSHSQSVRVWNVALLLWPRAYRVSFARSQSVSGWYFSYCFDLKIIDSIVLCIYTSQDVRAWHFSYWVSLSLTESHIFVYIHSVEVLDIWLLDWSSGWPSFTCVLIRRRYAPKIFLDLLCLTGVMLRDRSLYVYTFLLTSLTWIIHLYPSTALWSRFFD